MNLIIFRAKKLKKISFECEGDIIFAEAFKNSLTEMSKVNNSRYYLLTILSGNVKDRDEIIQKNRVKILLHK